MIFNQIKKTYLTARPECPLKADVSKGAAKCNRTQLGSQAEKLVGKHLEKQGFKVLAYNYKKKFGEIDVIAQKDKLLIFVEVKMRTNPHFDSAQLITFSKQKKIINVAYEYIGRYGHDDKECRFDVALVENNHNLEITYLINAFGEE